MKPKRQLSDFNSNLKVKMQFFWVFARALNYTDFPISPKISLIKF